MELINITHSIFRKNFERESNFSELKPYFYRFIGVKDSDNYNNILKTLESKCLEHSEVSLIFDNDLELKGEMELIQYIYNELNTMNIFNISREEITILDNQEINNKFLLALEYVVNLSVAKENFFNDSVRNNFITKLIVWGYSYLKKLKYDDDYIPKCIYYGNIERHAVYFLLLLHKMRFDVIYINPLKEEFFEDIDKDKLSTCRKEMGILNIESLKERASKGTLIENVESLTKQVERDIRQELFTGTGMFMPWQYRDGYTKSILIDGIVEDLKSYWNEPAKVRQGFKVEGNTVTVPCFFYKIDGQYRDTAEYQRLVLMCTKSENTLFFNNGTISDEGRINDDMYQLMFCQLSDGSFDINEIKKTSMYRFSKYSEEVQNLILNKFNEVVTAKDIFPRELDKEEKLKLLVLVLSMNEQIIRLVDNFDFTANIPKISIYLNNEDGISNSMLMLLGYIHTIGIDIVIFNPSGLVNIDNALNQNIVSKFRLDVMSYDSNYKKILVSKQGFLSRILNK